MATGYISCYCCGGQFPVRWMWYMCDSCGYRVCPSCFTKHSGYYNRSGGFKCSQCIGGFLKCKNDAFG